MDFHGSSLLMSCQLGSHKIWCSTKLWYHNYPVAVKYLRMSLCMILQISLRFSSDPCIYVLGLRRRKCILLQILPSCPINNIYFHLKQTDEADWRIVWEYVESNSAAQLKAVGADFHIISIYEIALTPITSCWNLVFENFIKVGVRCCKV